MTSVQITIIEATVTGVHEFTSFKGYGVDYFISAQSGDSTLYLQVVLYDNEARRTYGYIREGDLVNVTGTLKDKPYTKKDGLPGHSLIIERPISLKVIRRNCEQKTQEQNGCSSESAVSASANTAEIEFTGNVGQTYETYETEDDYIETPY